MNSGKLLAAIVVATILVPTGVVRAQTGNWATDPVATAGGCDNLEYVEIAQFLQTHYYPSLVYAGGKKKSGRQMLANYAIASTLVTRSQICLADALELKKLSDDLSKQAALLTGGTSMSKRQLKKQRALTAEANAEIEAATAQVDGLTPEQRERFGKGSAAYLAGAYATGQLFRSIDGYLIETKDDIKKSSGSGSGIGGLPGLGGVTEGIGGMVGAFGKAGKAGLVFVGLQDHVVNLYETSQFLTAYSQEQDIELPPDATDQLAEISDWV